MSSVEEVVRVEVNERVDLVAGGSRTKVPQLIVTLERELHELGASGRAASFEAHCSQPNPSPHSSLTSTPLFILLL